ncbi:MAG TPA: hypothetical protein VHG35_13705 [Gemmatimonadales bacterium]|nr:hypothetical protein [Gemmatimonadales bacterium]
MLRTPALSSVALRSLALWSLALPSAAAATLAAAPEAVVEPCDGRTVVPALEQMLPRARVALDLAGTDEVTLDPADRCIDIQVRTSGTARLVKLVLRGVEVPRSTVNLRVVEARRVTGT